MVRAPRSRASPRHRPTLYSHALHPSPSWHPFVAVSRHPAAPLSTPRALDPPSMMLPSLARLALCSGVAFHGPRHPDAFERACGKISTNPPHMADTCFLRPLRPSGPRREKRRRKKTKWPPLLGRAAPFCCCCCCRGERRRENRSLRRSVPLPFTCRLSTMHWLLSFARFQ